jgi:hypothetical protein
VLVMNERAVCTELIEQRRRADTAANKNSRIDREDAEYSGNISDDNDIYNDDIDLQAAVKERMASWRLTSKNARGVIKQEQQSREAFFVKCLPDELVGFAFATKIPVLIPDRVFDALSVNGLLKQQDTSSSSTVGNDTGADGTEGGSREGVSTVVMYAPYFKSAQERDTWQKTLSTAQQRLVRDGSTDSSASANAGGSASAGSTINPSSTTSSNSSNNKQKTKKIIIEDASTYLSLSTAERREYVRTYSGLPPHKWPRPREGSRGLDAAILPLLDIEVS